MINGSAWQYITNNNYKSITDIVLGGIKGSMEKAVRDIKNEIDLWLFCNRRENLMKARERLMTPYTPFNNMFVRWTK